MATYNKFQDFSNQLIRGNQDWDLHVYKIVLTNTAPVNTQTSLDTVTNNPAPAAANGYPAGGATTTITVSAATGTTTVQGTQVVFTAAGGQIGPFRYAILYNSSSTSPSNAMVAWWDYGSSITLNDTETFTVQFNSSSPGTILTLA